MALSIAGIGSGIDVQSLIDQLMQVAQQPLTDLNTKKSNVDSASQTLSTISTKLSNLKNAALALSTTAGFASYAATASDSSIVPAVSGAATPGSYSLTVSQLARAQKSRSDVQTSSSTALGDAGWLDIKVGSNDSVRVDVLATDTLSDIASKISSSGARVTASVFNDGTGARLLVQGLDTGAANAFTIDENGFSLGLSAPATSRSNVQTSSNTALGQAGSLDIKVGGNNSVRVDVLATDTLADVASKISSSGARVTASVVNDGSGYRLLVQGLDSGASNAFTIDESGSSLGFSAPSSASVYETAQDASLTVDGMSMKSPTNQITGAIAGVKLALTKTTTSPVTVQVSSDTTSTKSKINAFVTAYNDFVTTSHTATGFGTAAASNSVLAADPAVRSALHGLGSLLGQTVPGTTGAFTTLSSIGLSTKSDGTIAFDSTKFDAAIAKDPTNVQRLFVTDKLSGATGMMTTLMNMVDSYVTGTAATLTNRITSLGKQSQQLSDDATKLQTRLDDYQTQLKTKFSAMDQAVSKYQAQLKQAQAIDSAGVSYSSSSNSSNS